MQFLSPKLHGFIDYAAAVALIIAPFVILPASAPAIAIWFSVIAGAGLIMYSLITDYSVSIRNAIPFKTHLLLDFLAGVTFMVLPFILGFEGITKYYYLVMGLAVVMVVVVSKNTIDHEPVVA